MTQGHLHGREMRIVVGTREVLNIPRALAPELPVPPLPHLAHALGVHPREQELDVVPVPQQRMHNGRRDARVHAQDGERIARREPGEPVRLEPPHVDLVLLVEDLRLVVDGPVLQEEVLRHEGEVLGPPEVEIVSAQGQPDAAHVSDELVDERVERQDERVHGDVLPVHTPAQEAQALVSVGTAKELPDNGSATPGRLGTY